MGQNVNTETLSMSAPKFIAVSYRSGSETGLALYYAEGDDWVGVWTYANGTRIGVEKWARR